MQVSFVQIRIWTCSDGPSLTNKLSPGGFDRPKGAMNLSNP